MTPEALAALHARCFDLTPPPWSAGDFALLLALPGARLMTGAGGFALAQTAGPEAELLTIAIDPDLRRRGHARALLDALAARLAAEGVEEIFLEVAETNAAARALYTAAGYEERGRRRAYYAQGRGPAVDALVMARKSDQTGHAVSRRMDGGPRSAPRPGRDGAGRRESN